MVILETKCGKISGIEKDGYALFLGVPYARAGRFEYAKPVSNWNLVPERGQGLEEVFDASQMGKACPQMRTYHEHLEIPERNFYHKEFRQGLTFEYDEDLKSIFLGVISSRIRATDRDKFMLELKLPGGFVMLGGPVAGVYNTIKGILTVNGAKGRRKFIRYNCSENRDISGYITHNMKIYPFKTNIISTSGIVSVFDKDTARLLQKGVRIQNLFLNVKRKNINLSGHVYDIKPGTKVSYVIILFDGDMDANVKSSILGFIYDNLKLKMDFEIYRAPGDTTDYSVDKPPKQDSGQASSENFESPEANEILKDIGELEEVPQ